MVCGQVNHGERERKTEKRERGGERERERERKRERGGGGGHHPGPIHILKCHLPIDHAKRTMSSRAKLRPLTA